VQGGRALSCGSQGTGTLPTLPRGVAR